MYIKLSRHVRRNKKIKGEVSGGAEVLNDVCKTA
jgi:hypothetical protein